MKKERLSELSDEELLKEAKIMKPTKIYDAVIFGVLIGIAIYSSVTNGFGLFTFLPLVYLPVAARNKSKSKRIEHIIKERNLK